MRNLPDLTQLSHAQKDELIRALWPLQQQVQEFVAQMVMMQERIKQLEGRFDSQLDGATKLVFRTRGERRIEAVLLRATTGLSLIHISEPTRPY